MHAIVIAEAGGVEVLRDSSSVAEPVCGDNDVVVRNEYVGINYIDTYHRTGLYPVPLPAVLGREGAGKVEQVGAKVKGIRVGDSVGYLAAGAYAQKTAASDKQVVVLPSGIDTQTAATSLLQGMTACALTRFAYPVKRGDTILVHAAAGGTGRLLVQLCHQLGARVIATVSSDAKAKTARSLGADEVIIYSSEDIVAKVKGFTEGRGVHCVYDGVGATTLDASLASLRSRGVLVSFGNASGKVPPFELARLSKGNISIMRPTLFEYLTTREEFEELSSMLFKALKATVPLNVEVYRTYPLTSVGVQDAHRDLESRVTVGKLLLKVVED